MIFLHYNRRYLSLGILIFITAFIYGADVPSASIQDDSALRIAIRDTWLTEIPSTVLANRPFIRNLPGGRPVQVRAEARNDEFSVILARERNNAYPGWAQGSWIYTRNVNTGAPLRIRVFLRSDPLLYVQFRPMGNDRSQIDVVVYEAYIVRGLPIGIPFNNLLTMPLEDILAAAGNRFPRHYFDPDVRLYRDMAPFRGTGTNNFISRVRAYLPSLRFGDDGAIDENGQFVFIETLLPQADPAGLNCSGFAKWVVDGMLRPITGRRMAINPLKAPAAPRPSSLAPIQEVRDSLFGLDWTRNLALEAARVLRSPAFATIESVEIRNAPFSALINRGGGRTTIRNFPDFRLNAGFPIEGLRPLLYTLAINEPGHLYLASVNRDIGRDPTQRQHYHVAVLVPFFNEFGNFQTVVFESAAETNLAGFIARHPHAMVNLVRVPVEGRFAP